MTLNPRLPDVHAPPGTPVAYVHGLPLDLSEACAFQAFQAGVQTPADTQTLAAWRVKMVMIHGYGVTEKLAFINLEDALQLK
jgi:hypothetical protein